MTADLPVARHVVEAVGRDQPVELAAARAGRSGRRRSVSDRTSGKARRDGRVVLVRAPGVPVDRDDPPARAEQVGQRQRERALPRPDVGPGPARCDRRPEQPDVIGVVHRP